MTPEEARVVEAARLFIRTATAQHPDTHEAYDALASAVAALPVSLAERLPGLRPGAAVRFGSDMETGQTVVLANLPSHRVLVGEWGKSVCIVQYDAVTSIVSEDDDAG